MITITETALKKIVELKERLEAPVKGLRVRALPRSALRAHFAMRFVPVLDEAVNPSLATHAGGVTFFDFKDGVVFLELTGGCPG